MHSYKHLTIVAFAIFVVLGVLLVEPSAFAQSSQIISGVNYLKATQNPNGSWGGTPTTLHGVFPTTAAALEALQTLGTTLSPSQTQASAFLTAQTVEVTPFLAARILALASTDSDTAADVIALRSRQNTDGGWGTAEGFGSDALDTALALLALQAAHVTDNTIMTRALSYLTTVQNADGGWALGQGEASQVFYTALALQALNTLRLQFVLSTSQHSALTFLRDQQNSTDGGYGSPLSTAFETAEALLAILGTGVPLTPAEASAIDFLTGTQHANGSWADDAYSTALALRALAFPRDTDGDGMPDDFELAHGLDPRDPADALLDDDGDGLANLQEFRLGTHPISTDTDGDGVDDQTEIRSGSNPLDPASHNRPPVIASQPATVAREQQAYSHVVQASDPDGDPLTFVLLQAPGGMSITPAGMIQWTPDATHTQQGSFVILVQVSDGKGGAVLQQYRLTVLGQGVDLVVVGVDTSAVTTHTQTLVIGGTVQVTIQNLGGSPFTGSFGVLVFEDSNRNHTFEPGADNVVGATTYTGSIASHAVVALDVRVSGVVTFRDDVLYAVVDSAQQIPERDESNDLGHTTSLYHPPVGVFQPKVKWQRDLTTGFGVLHTPVVAPLIDTNGDGRIDARDVPAVVVITDVNGSAQTATLTALRGDTGAVIFATPVAVVGLGFTSVAVGDLDSDGRPEIVVSGNITGGIGLRCFNNDGTLKWQSPPVTAFSTPVIADLDGDGQAEILMGTAVFNANGTLRWNEPAEYYLGGSLPLTSGRLVADLDLDGNMKIIAGPSVLDKDGHLVWSWKPNGSDMIIGTLDGGTTREQHSTLTGLSAVAFAAVANVDNDRFPEVIVIADNSQVSNDGASLWIFAHDGRIKAQVLLFLKTGGLPRFVVGPLTVADIDGDGQPEIMVPIADESPCTPPDFGCAHVKLRAYHYDGSETLSMRWEKRLGPGTLDIVPWPVTAFDFDGDGAAELVYLDDQKLSILNGRDGTTLFEMGVNRNGAAGYPAPYPIVADVDNDGVAEIIVPTAEFTLLAGAPRRRGVLVLGDVLGNWRPARRVWNQWQYQAATINEDGSVPYLPQNNGVGISNLRNQGIQDGVVPFGAPDLTVSRVTIGTQQCPANLEITARIGNGGSLHTPPGIPVLFYDGDPVAGGSVFGMRSTTRALYPGEFEDVTLMWNGVAPGQVFVTVNERRPGSPIRFDNLALLPHAWAQGSGMSGMSGTSATTVQHNINAYLGIDNQASSRWLEKHNGATSISTTPIFYEVHFPFPVNATAVTVQNSSANTGFLGGTLTFSNGFSLALPLDINGAGTVAFPEQQHIAWVRLTASTTKPDGAGLSEFIVAGSYVEPPFRINEGEGRLGNNIAASIPSIPACGSATNQPPLLTSAPPISAQEGVAYTYPVQAYDPDHDPLTFALTQAPAGMVISAAGLITWTPTAAQTGDSSVTVEVSDGRGDMATQAFTIGVALSPDANQPAQIASTASPEVTVGQTYHYDVTATDPDGDVVVFALLQAPAGAAIEPFTGRLSWTPQAADLGAQFFTVAAEDGKGGSTIQSFAVTVLPVSVSLAAPTPDQDSDGFDATVDCDDTNPNVNPGQTEIPGNGVDDDCNPATPDTLPANTLTCALVTDKRHYASHALAELTATIQSLGTNLDIAGLQAQLTVSDPGGQSVLDTTFPLNTLAPQAFTKSSAAFSTETSTPGTYHATVTVRFGSDAVCQAQAAFDILASDVAGNALTGSMTAAPAAITQGQNATFSYQVSNVGNVDLPALRLEILVAMSDNATVVQSFTEQRALSRGASFTNQQTFASSGVGGGEYLVILRGGQGAQIASLASAPLHITARLNNPPVADAGRHQNAETHKPVTLNGSQSFDPDGDIITYDWSLDWSLQAKPAASTLTDADITGRTTPTPSFTPDVDGDYVIRLIVRDEQDASVPAFATVTATTPNIPPNAHAGKAQNAFLGQEVFLDGTASDDPDHGPQALTFLWSFKTRPAASQLTDADIVKATEAQASFVPDVLGTYILTLMVFDGQDSSIDDVTITVTRDVSPNADAGSDQTVTLEQEVGLDGSVSNDPDHGPAALTFAWRFVSLPQGSRVTNADLHDATTATPRFTPDVSGHYVVELRVSDGLESAFDNVLVTVIDRSPVCTLATAQPDWLWPPDHKLVPVAIVGVTDPDQQPVTLTVTRVMQDEPTNGLGDGDTSPDAVFQAGQLLLRAERAGSGNGRVYHVTFTATNTAGGNCQGIVTVCVPHSSKGTTCSEDSPRYDATRP